MSENTANNRKFYSVASVGKTAKDTPYAYALEGYVASATPFFKAAEGDKKAYLNVSIGLSGSKARLMDLANGTYDKEKDYGDKDEFASVRIYGEAAEKLADKLVRGRHIVVSGALSLQPYTSKTTGAEGEELVITADNVVDLGARKTGVEPAISANVGVANRSYTTKDGVVRTENMATGMIGTVIGCKGLSVSEKGIRSLAFGVKTNLPAEKICDLANGANTDGKEYDIKRTIVNVVFFNDQAERLSKIVRDGAIVVTAGPVEARDYNGNVSYQMRGRSLVMGKYAPMDAPGAPAPAAVAGTAAPAAAAVAAADAAALGDDASGYFVPMDDDDGTLPF